MPERKSFCGIVMPKRSSASIPLLIVALSQRPSLFKWKKRRSRHRAMGTTRMMMIPRPTAMYIFYMHLLLDGASNALSHGRIESMRD